MKLSKKILFVIICTLSTVNILAQNVFIPDANFKAVLVNNTAINTNNDSEIQISEASAYTGVLYLQFQNISDLTGISSFVNVPNIHCEGNLLTNLDISNNINLINLECSSNQLTTLDLSGNTLIQTIDCGYNQINNLNITNNNQLNYLHCNSNFLTTLDISNNPLLDELHCGDNLLTSLNTSFNINISTLWCNNNQLLNLNLVNNLMLSDLICSNNQISNLNLSQNQNLYQLYCNYNQLVTLNLLNNNNLNEVRCENNLITYLDISTNTSPNFHTLYCAGNNLNFLKLGTNAFYSLYCINNPNLLCIEVANVAIANSNTNWFKDATASYSLNCSASPIVYIPDVNFKTALVNNPSINTNNDSEIQLSEASTYSGSINVAFLSISDLTGISSFTSITNLDCNNNQLTNLDVSSNTALVTLVCGGNQLVSLNVSSNTALTQLFCNSNQLSSLNVIGNTALTFLDCNTNQINSLSVNSNTALTNLMCFNNLLNSLNISSNTVLTQLYCYNNSSLICIQVANIATANAQTNWFKDATASYSLNCPTTNLPSLILDTLKPNLNILNETVYEGARIHKYFKLKDTLGIIQPNIPVVFDITNQGSVVNTFTFTSDNNGFIDIYLDIENTDTTTNADDILPIGNYLIVPKYAQTLSGNIPFINTPSFSICNLNIIAIEPTAESYGFFINGSGEGGVPGWSIPTGGDKALGINVSIGGGLSLSINEDVNKYKCNLKTSASAGAELNFDFAKNETKSGMQSKVGLGSAGVEVGASIELKNLALSKPIIANDFLPIGSAILTTMMETNKLNPTINLLARGIRSYCKYSGLKLPESEVKYGVNYKGEFTLGPNFEFNFIDKQEYDGNNNKGLAVDFKANNFSGEIAGEVSSNFKYDNLLNKIESKYEIGQSNGWDFEPLKLKIGNFVNFSGSFGHSTNFSVSKKHDAITSTNEGAITFSDDKPYNVNITGTNFNVTKTIESEFTFGNEMLNLYKSALNANTLNNRFANYMTGSILSNLPILFDPTLGSANSTTKNVSDLIDYSKNNYSANWINSELSVSTTKNYLYSTKFSISDFDGLLKSFMDFADEKIDFKANIGIKWNRNYLFNQGYFSKEMDSILFLTNYANTDSYIKPPVPTDISNFWNEVINNITQKMTDIKNHSFDLINGFITKLSATVSNTTISFVNSTKSLIGLKEAKKTRGTQLINFSKIKIDINGTNVFNNATNLSYYHYFPGGEVFNAIKNTNDTCIIVSDIAYLEATENNNSLQLAPNGNYSINFNLGVDDLKFLSFDTSANYNMVFRSYNDTLWENLGSISLLNNNKTILTNKLGCFAISKIIQNDTIPPSITINPPSSLSVGNIIIADITDNISGVDWNSAKVQVNGIYVAFERDGLTNSIIIKTDSLVSILQNENLIGVSAKDLVGNTRYTVTNIVTSIKEPNVIQSITLFPNPANSVLFIKNNINLNDKIDYKIFDLNGKNIKSGCILNSSNQINISDINNGIYFIELKCKGINSIYKFVKH